MEDDFTGKPIKIISMGTYLPQRLISNDLESKHQIPHGWSERYSGVASRHHVTTESNGFMGARAAEKALQKMDLKLKDMDMLISAGGTFDYPLPNQASTIKSEMADGLTCNVPAIDIDSTCLSFVTALDFASRMLDGKDLKRILIVSSEISSKGLDQNNWETATLFGDGAAAAIVEYDSEGESQFVKGCQETYSEGVFDTIIEGGGNVKFFKDHAYSSDLYSFKMNGKNLLRLAKKRLPKFIDSFFENLPIKIEQTDVIIPHQASKMGLLLFENLYAFKNNQIKETLNSHGNCIAASIPITLNNAIENGEIKRGDLCLMIGTSAGFSIGAVLIRY